MGECFFWYRLTRVVPDKGCKMVVVVAVVSFHLLHAPRRCPTRRVFSVCVKVSNDHRMLPRGACGKLFRSTAPQKAKACCLVTFRVSRRRREMYCGHARLCVCLSVCVSVRGRMPTLLHGPECNLGNGRGCPLVVHYGADLQSGHGLRCYGNIMRTRNVSEYTLVLAVCLVDIIMYTDRIRRRRG